MKYISSLPPVLALWLILTSSNYPCLEHIFIVSKVFELLRFDCKHGQMLNIQKHRYRPHKRKCDQVLASSMYHLPIIIHLPCLCVWLICQSKNEKKKKKKILCQIKSKSGSWKAYALIFDAAIRPEVSIETVPLWRSTWPQGYKTFFRLNLDKHEILNAHKNKHIKKFRFFRLR